MLLCSCKHVSNVFFWFFCFYCVYVVARLLFGVRVADCSGNCLSLSLR